MTKILNRFSMRSGLAIALLVMVASCDQGLSWKPRGWTHSDGLWHFENDQIAIRIRSPGGLVASRWLVPEPYVANRTTETLAFQRPLLRTLGVTYAGSFGGGEEEARDRVSVGAGEEVRMPIFFNLDASLAESMGDEIVLEVWYGVEGEEPRMLSVLLEKSTR